MKFSVTIPAYKRVFLKEAIESVLRQTYQDYELIIVDDCSPEDLTSVVNEFKDPRIHYYRNEHNCGAENVVDNWNICLSHCSGEWVICMGDDDMLMPNCLEEYAKAITLHPGYNSYHCRVRLIDETGSFIKLCPDYPEHTSQYGNIIHYLEGRSQYIGDFCFNAQRLRSAGGYFNLPYAWCSDDVTSFIMGMPMGTFNISIPIFSFRISPYSISSGKGDKQKFHSIMLTEQWINKFILEQEPSSTFEKEELKTIESLLPGLVTRSIDPYIISSIHNNYFQIFNWLFAKYNYGVSRKHILKIAIRTLFHLE